MANTQNQELKVEKYRGKYAYKRRLLYIQQIPFIFAGPILQAIDKFADKYLSSELHQYYREGYTHVIIYSFKDVQK